MQFKKVIDTAIKQEEDSYKIYMKGYRVTKLKSSKLLFKKLAGEELKHKKLLQNIDLSNVADFPKTKYKSLYLEEDLQLTPLNELNEVKTILNFTIKKEIKAYKQYSNIAKTMKDDLKVFFTNLAKEEQKHKILVSKEYKKLF